MEFKIWPWDRGNKPFFVSQEEGTFWYVDKSTTEWCTRETVNNLPPLNAICFYVAKEIDGEMTPISRVLIDRETNDVIADEHSLEALASKIDMLRLSLSYEESYEEE